VNAEGPLELGSRLAQTLFIPRHQHEVEATPGEGIRETSAQTSGGSGDDGGGHAYSCRREAPMSYERFGNPCPMPPFTLGQRTVVS
jgi:hypothetical protein